MKAGRAPDQLDAVAIEMLLNQREFLMNDLLADVDEIRDGDVSLGAGFAEQPALVRAGEMQHRFAQRLGGDRARVDRRAAEHVLLLDDGDGLSELGGLDRGLLPGGAGADHDAVEMAHGPRG